MPSTCKVVIRKPPADVEGKAMPLILKMLILDFRSEDLMTHPQLRGVGKIYKQKRKDEGCRKRLLREGENVQSVG